MKNCLRQVPWSAKELNVYNSVLVFANPNFPCGAEVGRELILCTSRMRVTCDLVKFSCVMLALPLCVALCGNVNRNTIFQFLQFQ